VTDARNRQRHFGDPFLAEAVGDLQEPWMRHVDRLLDDETLVGMVHRALQGRRPHSARRGRTGTSADVVLRLLVLKHLRNWSYAVLEREVRTNLVYRTFTRVGGGKVPDAKTMGRWGPVVGPEVVAQLHARLVTIARDAGIIEGRRMRVDTTVTETDIHYPTDSSLLGDGVRVLTRTMQQVTTIAGIVGTVLRDRSRSVKRRLIEIGRIVRAKGVRKPRLTRAYQRLFDVTSRVVGQATRFAHEIRTGVKRTPNLMRQLALDGLRQQLETFVPRVQQVLRQARARILRGNTHVKGKLLSVFEPTTEVIRKGKAGKPNEFGKVVKVQEAEQQIIIHYEVYDQRPNDVDLLLPAIDVHTDVFGHVPRLVTADAAFYSGRNEDAAHAKGVRRVSIPNRSTTSAERKREQKKRWFKNGQRWRTGSEGRISVIKRRHGLRRSRYKGDAGLKRWVGLGVIADNLINIGRVLAMQSKA
jgi:IS5 family transposase